MHRKYFMLAALPIIGAALVASLHVAKQVAAEERDLELKSPSTVPAPLAEDQAQPGKGLPPWRAENGSVDSTGHGWPFAANGWAASAETAAHTGVEPAALAASPIYTISMWESQVEGFSTPNTVITAEVKRAGATVGYGVGRADAIGAIPPFNFYSAGKSASLQGGDSVLIHAGANVNTTALPSLTAVFTSSSGMLGGRLTH
jgi:hypothetical protein